MKKFIFVFTGILFMPAIAGAHGMMMDFDSIQSSPEMMQYVEDQALQNNDELHEEMEDLMIKMMAGNLTQEEANRLAELMDQYPGAGSMMMSRYGMMGNYGGGYGNMMNGFGWGMMGGTGTVFAWLFIITWLAVGVLAAVWLWKQIQKH